MTDKWTPFTEHNYRRSKTVLWSSDTHKTFTHMGLKLPEQSVIIAEPTPDNFEILFQSLGHPSIIKSGFKSLTSAIAFSERHRDKQNEDEIAQEDAK